MSFGTYSEIGLVTLLVIVILATGKREAFGTYSEIGLVALLAFLILVGTKIGSIGGAVGGWLARKKD